jgi:hypothetical protein
MSTIPESYQEEHLRSLSVQNSLSPKTLQTLIILQVSS